MIYKKILLASSLLVLVSYFIYSNTYNKNSIQYAYESYLTKYNKQYSQIEKQYRFIIFKQNYQWIKQHNKLASQGFHKYTVGINKFTDLTIQQYKALYLHTYPKIKTITSVCLGNIQDNPKPPENVDWSKKAATQVQDQGTCGSSWAFSATGAIEGLYALNKGRLIKLSDQQLIDCSSAYGNQGCGGGFMDQAFWYVIDNGIGLDSQYPYSGSTSSCKYKPSSKYAQFKDCVEIQSGNYSKILSAVTQQPVATAVDASSRGFISYQDGIFDDDCGININRGVLIVGYGNTTDGTNYWKIKNSQGVSWGQKGYMQIKRDIGTQANPGKCGLYLAATIPKNVI